MHSPEEMKHAVSNFGHFYFTVWSDQTNFILDHEEYEEKCWAMWGLGGHYAL